MYLSFSCFPSHSLLCRHTTIPAQHCRLSSGLKHPGRHWEGGIPSGQAVSHWHLLKDAITKKRTAEVAEDMFHFHLRQHRHLKSHNLSSLPPYTLREREAKSPSLIGVLKVLMKMHVRRRLISGISVRLFAKTWVSAWQISYINTYSVSHSCLPEMELTMYPNPAFQHVCTP